MADADSKRLVAAGPLRYARRDMRAGDVFEAPPVDAGYLVRNGRAKAAPALPAVLSSPAVVDNPPATPEEPPGDPDATATPKASAEDGGQDAGEPTTYRRAQRTSRRPSGPPNVDIKVWP